MLLSEISAALDIAKPALSSKDYVPIFQHFIFDQKTVLAFNDRMAIEVDLESELDCAVPGDLLIQFLKSGKGGTNDDLDVEIKDGTAKFFCLGFEFELPILGKEKSIFVAPEYTDTLNIGGNFRKAVSLCLVSVDDNSPLPEYNCVQYIPLVGEMYASNGITISKYVLEPISGKPKDMRLYLPNEFCKAFLAASEEDTEYKLHMAGDMVVIDLGSVRLFTKQPTPEKVLDFESVIEKITDGLCVPVEVFPGLWNALSRAQILSKDTSPSTELIVNKEDGFAKLITKTGMGIVEDILSCEDHDSITAIISASLISKALSICSYISISEKCVELSDGEAYFYYVANRA